MNDTSNSPVNNVVENPNPVVTPVQPVQPVQSAPVEPVTPVQPVAPATPVTPVTPVQPVTPMQPVQPAPVEVSPVQSTVEDTTKKEDTIKNIQNENNEDGTGEKRFPYAIVVIVVVLIAIATGYYFFWITPENVFDKAINNTVDTIKNVLTGVKDSEHDTTRIKIDTILRTAGPTTKNDKNIEFVDELEVGSIVDVDIKNFDLGVKFFSDLKKTSEKMQYGDELDIAFDYVDENIYVKTGSKEDSKVAKYTTENGGESRFAINYQRIDDAIDVFEKVKDQVVNLVDNKKLERKITTKKIIDQTAIAIKVSTQLNNAEIAEIWDKGFTNLYQDNDFMNKLSNVLGMTKEEVQKLIGTDIIENHKVHTQNIAVNLYMNLANTQLLGLDVTVDKYFVEINYLNGYYYIDIKINDTKDGKIIPDKYVLNIVTQYDNAKGILDLTGIAELEDETYLEVDVEYKRKTSEDSNRMIGNTLSFKFYDEDVLNSGKKGSKPFCTLDCTLDITYDGNDLELVDPKTAVDLVSLSGSEIKGLTYTLEKLIYEYKFVYGRLLLNRKDDTFREQYLADAIADSKNIVSKLVSSAAGSITYEQMVEMTLDELKEKMDSIKDLDQEQKDAAYDSIVENIKASLTYDEINSMSYDKAKELLKSKLSLLDKKYQTQVYDAVTEVMNNKMTYEFIKTMSLEDEEALLKKAELLPEENKKKIMNHIIDEVKKNVTYDDIVKMTIEEEKDLLSRVNKLPDNYKKNAYTEITNIITPNLKYDEIVKMSNDEIKELMKKVEELPSANQKTILNKVADIIKNKVTYNYMLDLKIADEKLLLEKVELLPNKGTVYNNIAAAVNKGVTAKEIARLDVDKVAELVEKIKLLPKGTQDKINAQIVKASKELMANMTTYNVTLDKLLPKVCKLPKEVADQIQPGVVGTSMCK